jgi:hypothetical protein
MRNRRRVGLERIDDRELDDARYPFLCLWVVTRGPGNVSIQQHKGLVPLFALRLPISGGYDDESPGRDFRAPVFRRIFKKKTSNV